MTDDVVPCVAACPEKGQEEAGSGTLSIAPRQSRGTSRFQAHGARNGELERAMGQAGYGSAAVATATA
jgi:hypothetical protein